MEGIAMHKLTGTVGVGVEGKELKFSLPSPTSLKKLTFSLASPSKLSSLAKFKHNIKECCILYHCCGNIMIILKHQM